jgi:outer membrane murein-binding lipoprotein Lpp
MHRAGLAVLLAALVLAGCRDRRSFDERYSATANNIEERARNLDAEINSAETDRNSQE